MRASPREISIARDDGDAKGRVRDKPGANLSPYFRPVSISDVVQHWQVYLFV